MKRDTRGYRRSVEHALSKFSYGDMVILWTINPLTRTQAEYMGIVTGQIHPQFRVRTFVNGRPSGLGTTIYYDDLIHIERAKDVAVDSR